MHSNSLQMGSTDHHVTPFSACQVVNAGCCFGAVLRNVWCQYSSLPLVAISCACTRSQAHIWTIGNPSTRVTLSPNLNLHECLQAEVQCFVVWILSVDFRNLSLQISMLFSPRASAWQPFKVLWHKRTTIGLIHPPACTKLCLIIRSLTYNYDLSEHVLWYSVCYLGDY